jgi:hypothetical protein
MIGVDRQHALVGPHGIVEFSARARANGFEEKPPDLFAGIGRVRGRRRAELSRRAALRWFIDP